VQARACAFHGLPKVVMLTARCRLRLQGAKGSVKFSL